jgi:membrane protein YdbS with pleckstrin-like domain
MKSQKVQVFLIKLGVVCFVIGICSIILALIFFREGQSETIWLIVFSVGALLVLFWLFIIFFIGRCNLCGAFTSVKQMRMEDGKLYCQSCGEMIYNTKQKPPPPGLSV